MRTLILLLPLALAACATTGSSDGSILIETASKGQPVAGANCEVRTSTDSWQLVTPGSVTVGNADGDLHVVCNKDGYRTSETIIKRPGRYGSSFGVSVGGGSGNVGVGMGLGIPINLGGGAYPSRITVDLTPRQD